MEPWQERKLEEKITKLKKKLIRWEKQRIDNRRQFGIDDNLERDIKEVLEVTNIQIAKLQEQLSSGVFVV